MPKKSYNLPTLTDFACKCSATETGKQCSSKVCPDSAESCVFRQPERPNIAECSNSSEAICTGSRDWHDPLCACVKDTRNCALTTFFPCCMACVEYRRNEECCGTPLCFLMSILPLTVQYRARQNIKGSIWKDCVISTFCYACQLCRLHRDRIAQEVKTSECVMTMEELESE